MSYDSERRRTNWRPFVVGTALIAGPVAFVGGVVRAHPRPSAVTWSEDVRPIIERRCAACHARGRTATPVLSDYAETASAARAIKRSVLQRTMPPWNVFSGFGVFENERQMSAHEVDVVVSWVDGGTRPGPPAGTRSPHLSRPAAPAEPDLMLDVGGDQVVDSTQKRYRISTSLPAERWIAGWRFYPGNESVVRRARITVEPDAFMGTWLPDEDPVFFPAPLAQHLPPRATVVLDVEYAEPSAPAVDRSRIGLYFAKDRRVPLQQLMLLRGATLLRRDIRLIAMTPELASAGQSARVVATRPDGSVEPLLWIRNHDARLSRTFRLAAPLDLPRGTRVEVWSFDAGCRIQLTYARTGMPISNRKAAGMRRP